MAESINGSGSDTANSNNGPYCQCAIPTCDRCGHAIDRATLAKNEVEETVLAYIKKAGVGVDELRRACKYIRKSFYSLTRDEMQSQLSQLNDKESIVRWLVRKVGVEALVAFIELLAVEGLDRKDAQVCIQTLQRHQDQLSQCVECASPVTTPTRPEVLVGSKTFYLFGSVAEISPSPSPAGSPIAPQLNILPSEILRFYSENCSEFDADFS